MEFKQFLIILLGWTVKYVGYMPVVPTVFTGYLFSLPADGQWYKTDLSNHLALMTSNNDAS